MTSRRLALILIAVLVFAVPAAVIRAFCLGNACPEDAEAGNVPFCSLPADLRDQLANGARERWSPEILAVAQRSGISGGAAAYYRPGYAPPWPSLSDQAESEFPVVFWGRGVESGAELPADFGLDDIAPTAATIIGLDRPHPEVRTGRPAPGIATGETPALLLEIVVEGLTSERAEAFPSLQTLAGEGASTFDARAGSLPLDPAAHLATIGTGGLPRQHGISGALVRSDAGKLVEAWGPEAPISVIATLGDDLDELRNERPRIGLVAEHAYARGLIGGEWYVGVDRDDLILGEDPPAGVRKLLNDGYGAGAETDLLAVSLDGTDPRSDRFLRTIVAEARSATDEDLAIVVAGAGAWSPAGESTVATEVERAVESAVEGSEDVIEATAPGGFFVDQRAVARAGVPQSDLVAAIGSVSVGGGFADVFPVLSVSFRRYC